MRVPCLLSLMLTVSTQVAQGNSKTTAIKVYVGEEKVNVSDAHVRVPFGTPAVRFLIQPKSLRIRYKLEGLDQKWRERTEKMTFLVRFLDKSGDQILQRIFPTSGTSNGWTGSVESSAFTNRRESLVVPEGAQYVSVTISSAGPPETVGIFAVQNVTIRSAPAANRPAKTFLLDGRVPGSSEPIWLKGGTHQSMASSVRLDGAGTVPLFIISDDDLTAHADWSTQIDSLPPVTAGELLEFQWREASSIGVGGQFSANYERLPSGPYRFTVEDLAIDGAPSGIITTIDVNVPSPYWKKFWFWSAWAVLVAGVASLYGRRAVRQKINLHLRHAQLIADERMRIARDLHDDLGTRLSHISLLASHSEKAVDGNQVASLAFREITNMSKELVSSLSETVWLLSPKNNDLESLVDFLCRIVSELCRLASIRCRIDAMSVSPNREISHDLRHNVSLAVKEAVNNALKHSRASEINLKIWMEGNVLKVTVSDNGIGFRGIRRKGGTGLDSIAERLASIRGKHSISEPAEGGLRVSLEVPIG